MTIRTKQNFRDTYLTTSGTWPDNLTGDITAQDLRDGIEDYLDSQTAFWPLDSSGIIGSDTIGLSGAYFNPSGSAPPHREGTVFYDSDNKTFGVYNDQPDMTLQLGQEEVIRVVNKTGTTITNGQAVRISGAQGQRPTIDLVIASKTIWWLAEGTVGLATHNIANNAEGYVTTQGLVRGLDTSSYSDGDSLYLSTTTSGAFQTAYPEPPHHVVFLGIVLNTHPTQGVVWTQTRVIPRLCYLSDVDGTTPKQGYVLGYNNSSGYWDPTDRLNTSGGFKFGDVSNGNYVAFEEDTGFEITYGSGSAWDDLKVPVQSTEANGSNAPVDGLFINNGAEVPGTGYALSFLSNTLGNLTLPDDVAFDTSSDFTFEFWVRPKVETVQNECVRKEGVFEVDIRNTNYFRYNVNGGANVDGSIQFNRGSWNHVAVVHDDSEDEVLFYLNGQEDQTIGAASVVDNTNDIVFNRQESIYDIDYVAFWSKAMSISEVGDRYANGSGVYLTGNEIDLKGLWELNDGSGTIAIEKTGISSDGNITGGSEGSEWDWISGHVGSVSGGSRGVILRYFSPDITNEVYFTIQVPHNWELESDLHPHVHWTSLVDGGSGEFPNWGLEYTWSKINGTFSNTSISYASAPTQGGVPTDIAAKKSMISSFPTISGTGFDTVSSQLLCRLFRDPVASGDTFDDFVGLIEFDIHYKIDSKGSREIFVK